MRASDEEVKRLAKECWDTRLKFLWFRDGAMGSPWEDLDDRTRESYRCMARHLIENLGCKAPPDPVREQVVAVLSDWWQSDKGGSNNRSSWLWVDGVDAILAHFNVTPKGGDDA